MPTPPHSCLPRFPHLNSCSRTCVPRPADGLFTNYAWTADAPRAAAAAAGARAAGVFFGTDVWGRGTYGGGGWNCAEALRVCASAGVSAALFAPAWVHESQGRDGFEARQQVRADVLLLYCLLM
eukprot:362599-Chlamydomonas_euryale.AAC.3